MYTQIFTGNLVDSATFQNIDEEKSVVNFTVAVNFQTGKKNDDGSYQTTTTFFPCSKWVKGKERPKWLEYMTKGQKVLIESSYFKISTSEKDGKTYQNMKVFVDKIELIGGKKNTHSSNEQEEVPNEELDNIPF